MLIIDGAKYLLWTPENEEEEFHPIVREHSEEIFGENTRYIDISPRLKSESGLGSEPDGFVIDPVNAKLYIVEVELSKHDPYKHINDQLTRFINGLDNLSTKNLVVEALFDEIEANIDLSRFFEDRVKENLHKWLSILLSRRPTIVVIIEEKTPQVLEACKILMMGSYDTKILEFRTFRREDAPTVHAHLFETLSPGEPARRPEGGRIKAGVTPKPGEITSQPEYTMPILESLIELGGKAKMSEALARVHEKMRARLKEKDYGALPSGAIRWKNQAQWERNNMKNKGYLKKDSPFGSWEITDEGRKHYDDLRSGNKK